MINFDSNLFVKQREENYNKNIIKTKDFKEFQEINLYKNRMKKLNNNLIQNRKIKLDKIKYSKILNLKNLFFSLESQNKSFLLKLLINCNNNELEKNFNIKENNIFLYSNLILELINEDDSICNMILNNNENLIFLIDFINNQKELNVIILNYLLIIANLLLENEKIYKELTLKINFIKILNDLFDYEKNVFLFLLYSFLFYCPDKKLFNYENFLFKTINLLDSYKTNENIYDILLIFSKEIKFANIFIMNYDIIFKPFQKEETNLIFFEIISNLLCSKNLSIIEFILNKGIFDYIFNILKNIEKSNDIQIKVTFKILMNISSFSEISIKLFEINNFVNYIYNSINFIFSNKKNNILLYLINFIYNLFIIFDKNFIGQFIRNNFHINLLNFIKNETKIYENIEFIITIIDIFDILIEIGEMNTKCNYIKIDLDNLNLYQSLINIKENINNDKLKNKINCFLKKYYKKVLNSNDIFNFLHF